MIIDECQVTEKSKFAIAPGSRFAIVPGRFRWFLSRRSKLYIDGQRRSRWARIPDDGRAHHVVVVAHGKTFELRRVKGSVRPRALAFVRKYFGPLYR